MNPYYNPNTGYPQTQQYSYPPQQYPQQGMPMGAFYGQPQQQGQWGTQQQQWVPQGQQQAYYPQPGMATGPFYGQAPQANTWGTPQNFGPFPQVQQVHPYPGFQNFATNPQAAQPFFPQQVPGLNYSYVQPQPNVGAPYPPGYPAINPQPSNPYYNTSAPHTQLISRAASPLPEASFNATPIEQPIPQHMPVSIESKMELDEDILESYTDQFSRIPNDLKYSDLDEAISEFMDWMDRQHDDHQTKELYLDAFLNKVYTEKSDRKVYALLTGHKIDKIAINDFLKYIQSEKHYLTDADSSGKFDQKIIHFVRTRIDQLKDDQEKNRYIKELAENSIFSHTSDEIIIDFLSKNKGILNSPRSDDLIELLTVDTIDKHDFIFNKIKNQPETYYNKHIEYILSNEYTDVSHVLDLINLIQGHISPGVVDEIARRIREMGQQDKNKISDDQLTQLYSRCENEYNKQHLLNLYTHRISAKERQNQIKILEELLKKCNGYDVLIQEKLLELARKEDTENKIWDSTKTKEFAYLKQFLNHPNCNPEDYKYQIGSKQELKDFILHEGLENWSPDKNEQFLPVLGLKDEVSKNRYVTKSRELLEAAQAIKTQAEAVNKNSEQYQKDPAHIEFCKQLLEHLKNLEKDSTSISSIATCLNTIKELLNQKYTDVELSMALKGQSPTKEAILRPLRRALGGIALKDNPELVAEKALEYSLMQGYELSTVFRFLTNYNTAVDNLSKYHKTWGNKLNDKGELIKAFRIES